MYTSERIVCRRFAGKSGEWQPNTKAEALIGHGAFMDPCRYAYKADFALNSPLTALLMLSAKYCTSQHLP